MYNFRVSKAEKRINVHKMTQFRIHANTTKLKMRTKWELNFRIDHVYVYFVVDIRVVLGLTET